MALIDRECSCANCTESRALREMSEQVLGWRPRASFSLSMSALRSAVRGKSDRLDKAFVAWSEHDGAWLCLKPLEKEKR